MSKMADVLLEAFSCFHIRFLGWGRCCSSFLCCVLCFVCLCYMSCVQCYLSIWTVNTWLPLRFSLMFTLNSITWYRLNEKCIQQTKYLTVHKNVKPLKSMYDKTQRHTTYKDYLWKNEMTYNTQSLKTHAIYNDYVFL